MLMLVSFEVVSSLLAVSWARDAFFCAQLAALFSSVQNLELICYS